MAPQSDEMTDPRAESRPQSNATGCERVEVQPLGPLHVCDYRDMSNRSQSTHAGEWCKTLRHCTALVPSVSSRSPISSAATYASS